MAIPDIESVTGDEGEATERELEPGIGLALSGGGYRATLFHVGAIIRLYEFDLLKELSRISSVSGGSITAGRLAVVWDKLASRDDLITHFVNPIRELTSKTLDRSAILRGLALPGTVSDVVANKLDKELYEGATLQDLPDWPMFTFNATNLESGRLWRFQKAYMRDWKVGGILKPEVKIAQAVTASAAFPPVLSPFKLRVKPEDFDIREVGVDDSFFRDITLTDGGVYDNYGLEPVWKRFKTVLVSDGGSALPMQSRICGDWITQLRRVISVIQSQVHAQRSRLLVEQYLKDERAGAFWSIATPPSRFNSTPSFAVSDEAGLAIAQIATRLKAMNAAEQERLINFGYVQTDNAVRSYFRIGADRGAALPYPDRSF